MLHMFIEYKNGILIIKLDGYLNRETSYKINSYLIPVIMKQKIKNIVIDMKMLKEIDDTGKEALLNLKGAIKDNKGEINITNVNYKIDRAIRKLSININNNILTNMDPLEV